jgi:hypothetical protein
MDETDRRPDWSQATTSSYSNGGAQCAEVAPAADGGRVIRNNKDPRGSTVYFTGPEWDAFTAGMKAGEFDR